MQGPVQYTFDHLRGALRLFRLDTGNFAWLDASPTGVIRSFRVAVLVLPLWILTVRNEVLANTVDYYAPAVFAILAFAYVISWTLGPVVMWEIARLFDRKTYWRRHVAVSNWADFWIRVLPLPINIALWQRAPDDPVAMDVSFLILLLTYFFAGYLLVKTMEFRVPVAVALTICLFMMGIAYSMVIMSLLRPFMLMG